MVVEQQQSGQNIAAFCREGNLPSSQLFAWKRRLREAETAQFVSVEVAEVKRPSSSVRNGGIEVRLDRGRSIVVEPGFDAHHLRALLAVLEAEA